VGAVTATWCGSSAAWWVPFERSARRRYGNELRIDHRHDRIDYLVPLDVLGRTEAVPILVQVWARPPYCCYGLAPEDYPRVYGDRWRDSPHRHPDDALCLYKPTDPPGRRWRSIDGLDSLLELVRLHLFYEDTWRLTRRRGVGIWAGPEARHGLGKEAA
jgi:hypothetical protein